MIYGRLWAFDAFRRWLGIQRPGETEIMRHDDPKYCIYCNEELDPGQIFECRKCDRPMCRSCWKVRGGDLCEDCST